MCDRATFDFLTDVVGVVVHPVAHGMVEDSEFVVAQATTVLDVVDKERSVPSEYSSGSIGFAHIPEEHEPLTLGQIFRVKNPELVLQVFVGDDVKSRIDEAGLTGWRFEMAWVSDDAP